MVGVCRCESWNCDDLVLSEDDVAVWEVNWSRLGRALVAALGCEPREVKLDLPRTMQIGAFGPSAVPVVLTIPGERQDLENVVCRLAVRLREGFIVLTPTNRLFDARVMELMGIAKAGHFALESHVTVLPSGALVAKTPGGELFARFLPEDGGGAGVKEAARVFGLIKRLESEPRQRKAPLVTVFRLLVLEGRSQNAVALYCRCAKSLVSARVTTIEERLGMSIERLRSYASTLREMETSVKAERRRRHQDGAIEWGETEESEECVTLGR
jgi:hypothetical protein